MKIAKGKIAVFAGTTEGRVLASRLAGSQVAADVFVATEYGKEEIPKAENLQVHDGRVDEIQMEKLFQEKKYDLILDATHPFAVVVTANIREAAEKTGTPLLRILRDKISDASDCRIITVENIQSAVDFLKTTEGPVFVTTGSKELSAFLALPDWETRVYARVLSMPEVVKTCADMGFYGSHLIAMQGPFAEDLNVAMMKAVHAKWMVTKESGKAGGFAEKVSAAKKAGVGLVVIGGIKRIAKVSEIVVPFMAVLYVALGAIIIITNITAVPAALVSIIKSAFTGSALAGGAMGTMVVAMQKGIARGIFSNESGLGSAPIAAAAAKTKEPVRQGLVSMTGTFIDTIVICTMTGLSIVIAGTWMNPELEGVEITVAAFQKGLPFPPIVASFSLMLCLVFFAFTTILGWNYYGERCIEYLFNRNKSVVKGYRWLYILAVFIGPYMTVAAVWNIADIFNALMAFPNLIAILALSGVVVRETKDYFARQKKQSK